MSYRRAPAYRTRFRGRGAELERVRSAVVGGRSVAVVGPPGVGKTRLAAEVAGQIDRHTVFCDLARARDADGIGVAVLRDLRAPPSAHGAPTERAASALEAAGVEMAVLDNVEQASEAVSGVVTTWMERVPGVTFLLTSQVRLAVDADEVRLDPLPLPADGESLRENAAFQTFVGALPPHAPPLRAEDHATVAALIRRLEGMPLSLELAAARLAVLTPGEILDGLAARRPILSDPTRERGRHRALAEAIGWSWSLLSPEERTALARLTAFDGGVTRVSAEFALGGGALDRLQVLVARSLVVASDGLDGLRFSPYESVRAFVLSDPDAADDVGAGRGALVDHCAAALPPLREESRKEDGGPAFRAIEAELDNALAAIEAGVGAGDPHRAEQALTIVEALYPVLRVRWAPGRTAALVEGVLEATEPLARHTEAFVRAMLTLPLPLILSGRLADADTVASAAVERARALGLAEAESLALGYRASVAMVGKDPTTAKEHIEAGLVAARGAASATMELQLLSARARAHESLGERVEARETLGAALEVSRRVDDRGAAVRVSLTISHLALEDGDHQAASDALAGLWSRSLPADIRLDLAAHRGVVAWLTGDAATAGDQLGVALGLAREHDRPHAAYYAALLACAAWTPVEVAGSLAAEAHERASRVASRRDRALALAFAAVGAARSGDRGLAHAALDGARTLDVAGVPVDALAGLVAAWEALVAGDVAAARKAHGEALTAAAVPGLQAQLVRVAGEGLAERLVAAAAARRIARDGGWFEGDDGERVDLGHRPRLCAVVAAMVAHPEPLSIDALFETAWPGDRAVHGARKNRVRVAVSTLRKAGLPIEWRDGYRIAPPWSVG